MSLRRRLTLSLVTILILFSINVGTHFWGSFARNQSMEAYRDSVSAAQLSTEVEQLLNDQRQQILVLSTLRENTGDQMDPEETFEIFQITLFFLKVFALDIDHPLDLQALLSFDTDHETESLAWLTDSGIARRLSERHNKGHASSEAAAANRLM